MNLMNRIEEEINHFPEGSNNHIFFKQLCKNLEPDCLRKSVRKELNQSHFDLSESIQRYFKYHIIYTSALKAVDCSQLQQNELARDNVELFHLNILKKYVHTDKPCEKLQLFEGSKTLLTKMLENKQKSASAKLFSKSVEDNINEFCKEFLEYVLQVQAKRLHWEKEFDNAIKKLSPRIAILDSADFRFNSATQELKTVLLTYYKELCQGIEILNKLLELYRQKLESQLLQSKWITDMSKHLLLKLQCLELEVLASTYSKKAVQALTIIMNELEVKNEKTKSEINRLSNDLIQFQMLGPEYEQLVERYQQLVENIEKKKWAIQYLKDENVLKEK